MLVFEWETTRFEVVVEQHTHRAPFKVERMGREVLVDLGKFSCAATLRRSSVPSLLPSFRMAALTFIFAATFGVVSGISEAAAWGARSHINPHTAIASP